MNTTLTCGCVVDKNGERISWCPDCMFKEYGYNADTKEEPPVKKCPDCGLALPHSKEQCDAEIVARVKDVWKCRNNEGL